jgi:hypothetical protein
VDELKLLTYTRASGRGFPGKTFADTLKTHAKEQRNMRTILVGLPTAVAFLLGAALPIQAQGGQPALVGLPEYGVLLTGSPEVPVIVNHSGRAIIGFSMKRYTGDGGKGPAAGQPLVYLRSAAIADGAQYQPGGATDKKDPNTVQIPAGAPRPSGWALSLSPIVKAVLDGILFDNGEYVGYDFFSGRLDTYREIGKQLTAVKYGSDAEIAAVWSKFEEMIPWRRNPSRFRDFAHDHPDRDSAVLNLLQERDLHGERLAFDLAEYYSSLPVPWRKQ